MPKTIIDYSKAVIYKIEHMEKPELLYVGSTTDFIRRKAEHKSTCANSNVKNYSLKLYQMIRANDGWESFKIMIIKEFPCESKIQLIMEEEKYRKELQTTLNSCRAYRTNDEKKQYNIDYHDKNKELLDEYTKQYYQVNKEKKNEKITCECGCISLKQNMIRHKKSKKHIQIIQN